MKRQWDLIKSLKRRVIEELALRLKCFRLTADIAGSYETFRRRALGRLSVLSSLHGPVVRTVVHVDGMKLARSMGAVHDRIRM